MGGNKESNEADGPQKKKKKKKLNSDPSMCANLKEKV